MTSRTKGHEHNPLTMSDDEILERIVSTHVRSDTKFDVGTLFTLVHNTLTHSTHMVDSVVQGNSQLSLEDIEEKNTQANFSSPLCILRQISYEMQCKPPGGQEVHKTAMAILGKLSKYDWDAKAVLTLAAFAMEYGDFWILVQMQPNDLLVKAVATLKGVPMLTKPASLQTHRQAILELNSLTKSTLQVIKFHFELEQLSSFDIKGVPALVTNAEKIQLDVYWSIITIAAMVTQIDCLITESEPRQELSHYSEKINVILSGLRKQITLCKQQIEMRRMYCKIWKFMQNPTEISEVLTILFFSSGDDKHLYDGASKTMVSIDVLKKKDVYLFLSTLDITEEELSVVLEIDNAIKGKEQTDQYKIVWVPIVEEWTDQLRNRFDMLKAERPFFVVEHFGSVAGFEFIKEEWQFEKKPMVVTMNHRGQIRHHNAFHFIHYCGIEAFPFEWIQEEKFYSSRHWIKLIKWQIQSDVATWLKDEKYIFFYGGHDEEVQRFEQSARNLVDSDYLKKRKISIQLFRVEKDNENIFNRFWSGIESFFVTKVHKSGEKNDDVTKEVQKMLSYKNESCWALLSKGSKVVLTGHWTTIFKTVADFDKWKEKVVPDQFELSFREYHENVVKDEKPTKASHRCSRLEVLKVTGKLPEKISCPECPNTMKVYITYECCHDEATPNAGR